MWASFITQGHPIITHSAIAGDWVVSVLCPPHVLQLKGSGEVSSVLVNWLPRQEVVDHERWLVNGWQLVFLAGIHWYYY